MPLIDSLGRGRGIKQTVGMNSADSDRSREQIEGTGDDLSRAAHRRSIAGDLDALHGLLIATLGCLLSGGLLYLFYLHRVLRFARSSSAELMAAEQRPVVLLFGKHSPDGRPDRDFRHRIDRALALSRQFPSMRLLLLGGGPPPSEAEVARRALIQGQLPDSVSLELEDESRDTLQNLRHARQLLEQQHSAVVLLSNRYHLARCALFADGLNMPRQLCAAESTWRWRDSGKALLEALYCMWIDIGRRWAKLIGHQRMLSKVS